MALSVPGTAATLAASADPARVLTFIEVRSDAVGSTEVLLHRYVQELRSDASTITARVLQQIDRPEHFVLLESSEQSEVLAEREHHAQSILQSLGAFLTAPLDRRAHRSFVPPCGRGAGRALLPRARDAGEALYVVAHLDIAGAASQAPRTALERFRAAACHAAGNELFEVWQQANRGNHFDLIARWSTRQALSAFAASPAAREFRELVGPRLGSPYDERMYQPH